MRYTRDEIIVQGLDLASSPTVSQHDQPGGIVQADAYSIKWLQNALDMFHRKYPFSNDILTVAMTIRANNEDMVLTSDITKYFPTDYIVDVRNGITVTISNQSYRLRRKSYQYFLDYKIRTQSLTTTRPLCYCVVNQRIKVSPLLTDALAATLHYYALPSLLAASDVPNFPDEWSLIEFIRMKALEWTRSIEPGTAQMYLQKQLSGFRTAGLLNEPEYEDAIPLENNQVLNDNNYNSYSWMGNIGV